MGLSAPGFSRNRRTETVQDGTRPCATGVSDGRSMAIRR